MRWNILSVPESSLGRIPEIKILRKMLSIGRWKMCEQNNETNTKWQKIYKNIKNIQKSIDKNTNMQYNKDNKRRETTSENIITRYISWEVESHLSLNNNRRSVQWSKQINIISFDRVYHYKRKSVKGGTIHWEAEIHSWDKKENIEREVI